MARPALTNGLLTAALVACGLLVAALVYGFATRTLTPRTVPTRAPRAEASPTAASPADSAAQAARRAAISVEVLNGTGINGLAARTVAVLKRRGFDGFINAERADADSTTVAARRGTRGDALHVAGALGLPPHRVVARPATENDLDVTVTLGRDHTRFPLLQTPD